MYECNSINHKSTLYLSDESLYCLSNSINFSYLYPISSSTLAFGSLSRLWDILPEQQPSSPLGQQLKALIWVSRGESGDLCLHWSW